MFQELLAEIEATEIQFEIEHKGFCQCISKKASDRKYEIQFGFLHGFCTKFNNLSTLTQADLKILYEKY